MAEFQESKSIPEVDWSKSRKLEFQDAYKARQGLLKQQRKRKIVFDDEFKEQVRLSLAAPPLFARPDQVTPFCLQYRAVHEEKELQRRMNDLKAAISDQNLELLPDYESRIEVLKELRFIDDNSTVLLKGRVACEVRLSSCLVEHTPKYD